MPDNISSLTPEQVKKLKKKFFFPAIFTMCSIILFGLGLVGAIAESFHHQEGVIEFCLIMSGIFAMNAVYIFGNNIVELIIEKQNL